MATPHCRTVRTVGREEQFAAMSPRGLRLWVVRSGRW